MDTGIARILEFSADAHIKRHEVARDSRAYHHLTGAIEAFGKALEVLVALQGSEEFCTETGRTSKRTMVAGIS